jgi:1,4-alpha-glucan branching enzyme
MVTLQDGSCTFRLLYPHAHQVHVVGGFNHWSRTATPMLLDGGHWEARLQLPPGEYRFRYLVDGHRWLTDWAAFGAIPNRIDGWDSVVVVPAPRVVPAAVAAQPMPQVWHRAG